MKNKIFIKKTLLCLLVAFLCNNPLYAQWAVGITGGYNQNEITIDNSYAEDINYTKDNGYNLSLKARYQLKNWISFNGELGYIQKNYGTFRSEEPISQMYTNYTSSYIQAPLYATFSIGNHKVRGFVNLGGYLGYWAHCNVQGEALNAGFGTYTSYDYGYEFTSKIDNRFEAGLLAGAGIEYTICNRISIAAEARYQYSTTDLQKKYMENIIPKYNNTAILMLSVMHKF